MCLITWCDYTLDESVYGGFRTTGDSFELFELVE